MKYEITCDPTYTAVEVRLETGERFAADSGAMAWMSPNIKTETSTRGGMLAGLKRKILAGESFFQNVYFPEGGPGSVTFAPDLPGMLPCTNFPTASCSWKRRLPGIQRRHQMRFQIRRTERLFQ